MIYQRKKTTKNKRCKWKESKIVTKDISEITKNQYENKIAELIDSLI